MRHLRFTRAVLSVAAAGTVACASIASAQSQVKWEIMPFAGYYIASDLFTAYPGTPAATGSSHVELTNSFMWGGRLMAFNGRGGLEFSYTRAGSDLKLDRTLTGQNNADVGRLNLDSYDLNLVGYEPSGNPKVTPYGLIGIGWSITHPDINQGFNTGPQVDGKSLFNFSFGLGAKIEMRDKLAMRLEGRWRITDTNIDTNSGVWCDPFGYCYSYASQWYNSGELMGGLSYSFK